MKIYEISDGQWSETIEVENIKEAISEGRDQMKDGEWGDGKSIVTLYVRSCDADGDVDGEEEEWVDVEVGEDPDPPECIDGDEDSHDWQSPEWLGGCTENPGVWSIGGTQIKSTEVCSRCGAYRHYTSESTPGQHPVEPSRTEYEEADGRSEKYVREENARKIEAALSSADLADDDYTEDHALNGYTIAIPSDDEEDVEKTIEALRRALPDSDIEWTGASDTDADGCTTSDVSVTLV